MLEKRLQAAVLVSLLLATLSVPAATYALSVPPPDIYIMIEPTSQELQAGGSATFKVTVFPQGPFDAGNVTLSLLNPPQGVTATFSPEEKTIISGIPYRDTFNSTMTVTAAADAPQGQVTLSVQGKGIEYSTDPNTPQYRTNLDRTVNVALNIATSSTKTITAITTTTVTLTKVAVQTQTVIVTQTSISMNAITTSLTTTVTTAITQQASNTPNYAWALSATVATIVLAAVLISQRRTK